MKEASDNARVQRYIYSRRIAKKRDQKPGESWYMQTLERYREKDKETFWTGPEKKESK